jgi:DNA-binding FrmR family transcriptional regulator
MTDTPVDRNLLAKIDRLAAQVASIQTMLQQPVDCPVILESLASAEASCRRIARALTRRHIEQCVPRGAEKSDAECLRELHELVLIFDRSG